MPIIDVSGLTNEEFEEKEAIRKGIKKYLARRFKIPESTVTVTFISDDTIDRHEHIMARLYSKRFMSMEPKKLEVICDKVVKVLEIAEHPYNEAFPVPVMAMKGRSLEKIN